MKLTLTWVNRNVGEDGTRIYRSLTPFDGTTLPAVLATVGAGVATYDDTTVVRDTTYYYRFQVFKGTDTTLSNQLTAAATPRSGPGPQVLIAGDYEMGYFGEVVSTLLFSGDELAALTGLSIGTVQNGSTNWLKFAYKGKILFIPKLPLRTTVQWINLYTAGLVFGDIPFTTANLPTANQTIVPQSKIVSKAGDNYTVRLPLGASANPVPLSPANSTTSGFFEALGYNTSEWDDLMVRVAASIPPSQIGDSLGAISDLTLIQDGLGPSLCQELVSGNNMLARGWRTGTSVWPASGFLLAQNGTSVVANGGLAAQAVGWRPVLEYRP